jgi:hypothetical protein
MTMQFIKDLEEGITGRTPHPEDSIFAGSAAAAQQLSNLKAVIANPANITIKWDGYPAIIFGRLPNGKLGMADKYMFDRGVLVTSPAEWQEYDAAKATGGLRGTLYQAAELLWNGLNAAVEGSGYYWADLLYAGQLQAQQGMYVFKPNLVEYHVDAASSIGRLIANSTGGVVVHQYFKDIGAAPVQWNGQGLRNVPGGVAIISPTAGNKFKLKTPVQLQRAAESAVQKYGTVVDELLSPLPQTTKDKIKTYFNKRITAQTNQDLHDWLQTQISAKQFNYLVGENYDGKLFVKTQTGDVAESPAYTGLKSIFSNIYNYKQNLAKQLASQVQGIKEFINGTPAGEGFIFPTASGLVKIVDREVFSAANFAKMS